MQIAIYLTRLKASPKQPFSPTLFFPLTQYVYKLPDNIDYDNAVALTLNYVFAHYLLFEVGHLKPNQSVFIQSCAGGVVSIGIGRCSLWFLSLQKLATICRKKS